MPCRRRGPARAGGSALEPAAARSRRAGATLFGVVLCLAAWPLVTGRAQDKQVSYKQVPAAWREAAAELDRSLPANSRAMVLPGDLFSFYDWGGTVDPILPALTEQAGRRACRGAVCGPARD